MMPKAGRNLPPPWRWGIFKRKPCTTLNLELNSPYQRSMQEVYSALKSIGFRETYWQIVYPNQVGGLIRTPRRGPIEFHVRFFENGQIYTEMELGRSALLHILDRRLFLNNYIAKVLSKKLSESTLAFLIEAGDQYKEQSEKKWLEWSSETRFMTPSVKKKIGILFVLTDWRVLSLLMCASFAVSISDTPAIFPLVISVMLVIYVLAPKRL